MILWVETWHTQTMIRNSVLYVIKAMNKKASWLLPQVVPVVHKYVASWGVAADYTRQAAIGTMERLEHLAMFDLQATTGNSANNASTLG